MGRSVSLAAAEIKARLINRAPGVYSLVGRPEVCLIEVPTGNLSQFGGVVKIQKHTDGTTRVIGAAGEAVNVFTGAAALCIDYTQHQIGNTITWDSGTDTRTAIRREWLVTNVENRESPQAIKYGTTPDMKWLAANIVETLELGWLCYAETGTIWEGDWLLTYGNGSGTRYYWSWLTGLTVAVATRAPLKFAKSSIDFAPQKADYLAGADAAVLPYVTQAWDEGIAAIPTTINIAQPVISMISAAGFELGGPLRQQLPTGYDVGTASLSGGNWNTTNMFSANWAYTSTTSGTASPDALTIPSAFEVAMGQKKNGWVVPRLNGVLTTSSSYGAIPCTLVNPLALAPVTGFPDTFGSNVAGSILGPCFPAAYAADGWVPRTGGNVATDVLTNSRDPMPPLLLDNVVQSAPVPATGYLGDATRSRLGLFSKPWSTLDSFGGTVELYFHGVLAQIETRAESLTRAQFVNF